MATLKLKSEVVMPKTRDVQCFKCNGKGHIASQCPNKCTLIIRHDGEFDSTDGEPEDEMSPLEDASDRGDVYPPKVVTLVSRKVLTIQEVKDEGKDQRLNIFHTRCVVDDKSCFVIIDGGSCANLASMCVVEKLGLPMTKHPEPYTLQWMNECGMVKVKSKVLVSFSIGGYSDGVLCDVAPMQACHILLGSA